MKKKKLVVFSGAGISAESGLKTFRDSDGLWEEYNVMDVATPEAWSRDRDRVLEFYNKRRKQVIEAQPNAAHEALVRLEARYEVDVVTQNIDDLHERSGSSRVLHLHGNIRYARSTNPADRQLYPIAGAFLNPGDCCAEGYQLRPHVVWFGEEVPLMPEAHALVAQADVLIVTGTSLSVYPASGLIYAAKPGAALYLVDPAGAQVPGIAHLQVISEKAGTGVPLLVNKLLEEV